jgi:hypothetical protein
MLLFLLYLLFRPMMPSIAISIRLDTALPHGGAVAGARAIVLNDGATAIVLNDGSTAIVTNS